MIKGLISVIVPVYNTERYIEKCLLSLINQSHKRLEIICVDDASTDCSVDIIRKYMAIDDRIRLIKLKENKGVSEARNAGLKVIRGEYFGFVDSDDYIHENMYEALVTDIRNKRSDISTCSYCFDREGKVEIVRNNRRVKEGAYDVKKFMKYIYKRDVYKAVGGYVVTKLFRTNRFIKDGVINVFFEKEITNCEDVLFLAGCLLRARTISYFNRPLYFYVQRDSSKTHDYKLSAEKMSALDAYEAVIKLYEEHQIDRITVLWIKRFYVYRALLIVKHRNKLGIHKDDKVLREKIMKYFPYYCLLNIKKPTRIIEAVCLIRSIKK